MTDRSGAPPPPEDDEPDGARLSRLAALIAATAHDLATPMTAIRGYAELIARSVGDGENRRRSEAILEQATRVEGLIDGLKALARPGSRRQSFDLGALLRAVVSECGQGAEVEFALGSASPMTGEPELLRRALCDAVAHLVARPTPHRLRLSLVELETAVEIRIGEQPPTGAGAAVPVAEPGHRLSVAGAIVEELGGALTLWHAADADAQEIEIRLRRA